MAKRAIITLLTDFGLADHYVAAMKGVILGICPEARLVDISHEIRAFGIEDAAFTLGEAYPCFPKGTIHLVVVDPGVGSARRPLLVEADGHRFVGPDNGVLTLPTERDPKCRVREITAERYFRHPVSNTFHGRDIFAPVAAHLASGAAAARLGRRVADWVRFAKTDAADGQAGQVLHVDRYGNLITSFRVSELTQKTFELVVESTIVSQYSESYSAAPKGQIVVIPGSGGYLEVSVNQGDAAQATGAARGSVVTLRYGQP
jgi:S-adenosylmethionine hydrolase